MDLVVDTNVLFSALYAPNSPPGRIVELALEGEVTLYAPAQVMDELERNLRETLGYTDPEWDETRRALPVNWVQEPVYEDLLPKAEEAIGDPSDEPVVAVALLVGAPVVSGDSDFHPLEEDVVVTRKPRGAAEDLDGP